MLIFFEWERCAGLFYIFDKLTAEVDYLLACFFHLEIVYETFVSFAFPTPSPDIQTTFFGG